MIRVGFATISGAELRGDNDWMPIPPTPMPASSEAARANQRGGCAMRLVRDAGCESLEMVPVGCVTAVG